MSDVTLIVEPCEFWFVWTKTGHIPRRHHHTQAEAEAEADRLAKLKPYGKKYICLRAYRKCHVVADDSCASHIHPAGARVLTSDAPA